MLFLTGAEVNTVFRAQQILVRLRARFSGAQTVRSTYGYFVETARALTNKHAQSLQRLLSATFTELPHSNATLSAWIVPRRGSLSPWSSKATDIAHVCGLTMVSRIERGIYHEIQVTHPAWDDRIVESLWRELYDPMTQSIVVDEQELSQLFRHASPSSFTTIDILNQGISALTHANQTLGLALHEDDMHYWQQYFQKIGRNPSDAELMMFAQVNSEHCRHKLFNAHWTLNGKPERDSLFAMIRHTHAVHPQQVWVAYQDNAAVLRGSMAHSFLVHPTTRVYQEIKERSAIVFKVETHNHPTAISPHPGAATGSGGEMRDEMATGRGARTKAGLTGFSVSHLHIPNFLQPWEENTLGKPAHLASALDIMLEAPIGAAAYNNEFGRPSLSGYFRTLEMPVDESHDTYRGYHKPIMLAGGIGSMSEVGIHKKSIPDGAVLVVLGGPGMRIGLGGGSASSRSSAEQNEFLDFASVQRANPEMQRRVQEVMNACLALGKQNPILSVHDVGAGGLSNALPEMVYASKKGARIDLRAIPIAESDMSPLEIWCNESQERLVLAVKAQSLPLLQMMALRERCPLAVLGEATSQEQLVVVDDRFHNYPVDVPLSVLLGKQPPLHRQDQRAKRPEKALDTRDVTLTETIRRVLQYPCVADKSFLITIGDRTVGGLVARDQMVGPWQVPVADVAVTCADFRGFMGEAFAIGERSPIALLQPAAAARMAVGEAVTNLVAATIEDISRIALSANWMAAADYPGEAVGLYEAVQAVSQTLCPALGIAIPVGKDSLSMQVVWEEQGQTKRVISPLSLVVTAAAPVHDVRTTLTPQLQVGLSKTQLILIDLGRGAQRLGASVFAQVYGVLGESPPDLADPLLLRHFFQAIQQLRHDSLLLAYHDRSDGGLLVTLCEMAFAGRTGITVQIEKKDDPIAALFSEELGAVIQVATEHVELVFRILEDHELRDCSHIIGSLNDTDEIVFQQDGRCLYRAKRAQLHHVWSEMSFRLRVLRDHTVCAEEEWNQLLAPHNPGLDVELSFDVNENRAAPYIQVLQRPTVAILREQGVNGHVEMAAAFHQAGFDSVDVHMSDLLSGTVKLKSFTGLVACGGFSYGDVLGAGYGWAQSILMHPRVRDEFYAFFNRQDRFALGVCNGCQMFSYLKELIPGADNWPVFQRNCSEQFEARLSLVRIPASPSLFFVGMAGSVLPIAVAHGEGRAVFSNDHPVAALEAQKLVSLCYVDVQHRPTEAYPANPNGSPRGITGLTNTDGRITLLMPHPERVFRTVQCSWHPREWHEYSPWMRFFRNARVWVG
ncbi:MAG: phosphoribosylformylglycinamidine synthase [Coxiella sp. RIFCSPHIGHO2_12_FULL_44_14]|nr:MAG: phosphoribosylformylglycinamidine synthase [Coxiella sp. RIFCSPHIGHO2_12_FULL_44_14]